ncbi:hypothetical protein GCM10023170_070950 [Phytohabitans houttuyneae]
MEITVATKAARQIFDDLLNIEVNVISTAGMTGRKMPDAHQALLDIITHYNTFLCRVGPEIDGHWLRQGRPEVLVHTNVNANEPNASRRTNAGGMLAVELRTDPVPLVVSVATFDELRERAREAEAVHRHLRKSMPQLDDGNAVILRRIFRNCDQIKNILRRDAVARAVEGGVERDASPEFSLPLTADELITVRKVWEVGIEQILMQTVAQLDGDIVTRVDMAHAVASRDQVQHLHQGTLQIALAHWQFMFQTLAQMTSSAFRSFLAR